MLPCYSEKLSTNEINGTFYSLPSKKTVKNWHNQTPEDFIFAVKSSRYITHMKKLKDPEPSLKKFFKAIEPLGQKTGPVLFQCPPNWGVNTDRLSDFIECLPEGYRYTMEFRDKSWLCDDVYALLKEKNISLCFYDINGYQSPEITTADFIYIRLHGPDKAYKGSYDGRMLSGWAQKIKRWEKEGYDIYCYFDNDEKSYAAQDALSLLETLKKQ